MNLKTLRSAAARVAQSVMTRVAGEGVWLKTYNWMGRGAWNWWQKDWERPRAGDFERFGPIHTCVSIISQDLSRIPLRHTEIDTEGRQVDVVNRAPARLFRKPNSYQTRSDFILYLARSLLVDGNAYAVVGGRNDRNEITSLYPVNPTIIWPHIEPESGEYFYRIGHDATVEISGVTPDQTWLPPRDVLHIRLQTPRHPLIGETPLVAAVYATAAGTEINKQSAAFFANMSRPSGVLRHPRRLDESAMRKIKERFMELTTRNHAGEPLVLAEGMDWSQLQMTAVDAELIESYRLTERQIFQIYRVPPFLGGDLQQATLSNVESLTRFYLQSCLGFYVDHFEEAFTAFFALSAREHILFDLERALLRGDMKERMEAYGKAIQNGVFAPNEARARENLPPVEYGDDPRVQQQLVPLEYGTKVQPPGSSGGSDTTNTDEAGAMTDEEARQFIVGLGETTYSAARQRVLGA